MVTGKISLLFPGAEEFVKEEEAKAGVEFSDIRGKRVALVDNGRAAAPVALAGLRDILVKDYACEAPIFDLRRGAPVSTSADSDPSVAFFDNVASQADAVVVGVAT